VIHDDLARQFERTPQPALSPEFSINLRRRLRREAPARAEDGAWRIWVLRLYWIVAAGAIVRYWRPVELTPLQISALAIVGAAVVLTLRRGAKMGPLSRVLRDAIWR
jgi:hypothetical protein